MIPLLPTFCFQVLLMLFQSSPNVLMCCQNWESLLQRSGESIVFGEISRFALCLLLLDLRVLRGVGEALRGLYTSKLMVHPPVSKAGFKLVFISRESLWTRNSVLLCDLIRLKFSTNSWKFSQSVCSGARFLTALLGHDWTMCLTKISHLS